MAIHSPERSTDVDEIIEKDFRVRAPYLSTYGEVKRLVQIFQDISKIAVNQMIQDVHSQTGTPQNPVDWTDPDTWIHERLEGNSAELAEKIWIESEKEVNPRYVYGSYYFINLYGLLTADSRLAYQITDVGKGFIEDDKDTIAMLDRAEGLNEALSILSTKQRVMRADLLPEWADFLMEVSKFGTASTIKDTLRRRLLNLVDRGYVERSGNSYSISKKGIRYIEQLQSEGHADPKREVNQAIAKYNKAQRKELKAHLESIQPFLFVKYQVKCTSNSHQKCTTRDKPLICPEKFYGTSHVSSGYVLHSQNFTGERLQST